MSRLVILVCSFGLCLSLIAITATESHSKIRMIGSSSSGGTGNPSSLYEIDPATGAVTLIGPIGFNRVGAMATHPTTGVIYATGERASDSSGVIISIDPTTGVGTEFAPTFLPGSITDITFRPDGVLFLHLQTGGTTEIYRIGFALAGVSPLENLGGSTFIGTTGLIGGGGGLAYSPTDSLILHLTFLQSDNFYEVNQSNGMATFLTSAPSILLSAKAMAFHPTTGALYVVDRDQGGGAGGGGTPTTELRVVNYHTGVNVLIGTTLGALDGITFIEDTPPVVVVLAPNGGEVELDGEYTIQWNAVDDHGVDHVDIAFSPGYNLYGSTSGGGGSTPSILYEIDPASAETDSIGPIGFNRVGAMDQHPGTGVIYGVGQRSGSGESVLITIDPITGAGSEVGLTNFTGGQITDISFRPSGNILYGVGLDEASFSLRLMTFDLSTGAASVIGGTGDALFGAGATFAPNGSLFLQFTDQRLPPWYISILDPLTGQIDSRSPLSFPSEFTDWGRLSAMDYDPMLNEFHAIAKNDRLPASFTAYGRLPDPVTFTTVDTVESGMDGIVWAMAPCISIATGEPNDGQYGWIVPGDRTYTGIIKITAFDDQGQERTDISDTTFIIRPIPPEVEVTIPIAGDYLIPGEKVDIQWIATDNVSVASVDIAYVVDLSLYTTTSAGGSSFPSELFELDPETGFGVLTGSINYNRVGAISMDPETGILYAAAVRPSDGTPVLITVDPVTGAGYEIGPTGIAANITDLAFDRVFNQLYGHRKNRESSSGDPTQFYTFDTNSGAASFLGETNRNGIGGGVTFSLNNRLQLALLDQSSSTSWLHRVNGITGGVISSVPLVFPPPYNTYELAKAMDTHPLHGTLYGIGGETLSLVQGIVTINSATGEVAVLDSILIGMDGLAFGSGACIPIATGETNDGSYSWTVPTGPTPTGRVKITAHDNLGNSWSDMSDGFFTIGNTTDAPLAKKPATTFLAHAAPNPFQNTTTIRFGLARPGPVRLAVYDARGRLTRELVSGTQEAGPQVIQWDGRDHAGRSIASGVYILRLEANGQVMTRRLSLIR